MGFIQEISELIRKGPELQGKINDVKLNTKSVARGAKDSTFQFPCLISDTIPVDMANTTARYLDQVYASFTQTWLSMNAMFDITIDPTPLSYLRKLHQNLRLESNFDDMILDSDDIEDYMENVYDGKYRLYMNPTKTFGMSFNMADHLTKAVIESHKEQLNAYLSDYDLTPIEVTEADAPSAYDFAQAVLDGELSNREAMVNKDKMSWTSKGNGNAKILDADIKKSNDMMPFGIQVRLLAVNDKKEFVQYVDVVIGVKTILHPVKSNDMIENIVRTLQNKSALFKFLRWTTGEISLFKDIILNIDNIKTDTANKYNGKSPFFNTLKRLKNKKLTVRNFTVPGAVIPNATIVVSNYEVDELKQKYAIDVNNVSVAKKLMSGLFLMSFMIMDEGMGTISVLYDGDDAFQTYSVENIERENSLSSNKLGKEIGRMISR